MNISQFRKENYDEILVKVNESRDDTDYYAHMKKNVKYRNPLQRTVLSPPKGDNFHC